MCVNGAPDGTRTHTVKILNLLPLPLGYWGREVHLPEYAMNPWLKADGGGIAPAAVEHLVLLVRGLLLRGPAISGLLRGCRSFLSGWLWLGSSGLFKLPARRLQVHDLRGVAAEEEAGEPP